MQIQSTGRSDFTVEQLIQQPGQMLSQYCTCLRACYEACGTGIAYGAVPGCWRPLLLLSADRQTHRQTDTQTDRHTDRQTGRQTHRHTDTQTHGHADRIGCELERAPLLQICDGSVAAVWLCCCCQTHRHTETQKHR
eukprot:2916337-Rhodomonas_salina.1